MPYPGAITDSGDYAVDQLPFAMFNYVYGNPNPTYLPTHLLLSQWFARRGSGLP